MPEVAHNGFNFYFVAYIDILGFSKMVNFDIENPESPDQFLNRLFKIYETTKQSFGNHENLQVIQFSDSVVFAIPYTPENFPRFLNIIGRFQYNLFSQCFLCRGGISFGKHFYAEGFLFSSGLIEAYTIEKSLSRYPRIVVSNNLLDLIYPHGIEPDCPILKENDDTYFVDFIDSSDLTNSVKYMKKILENNVSNDASINEKHRWLREYFDYKVQMAQEEIEKFSNPRFSGL